MNLFTNLGEKEVESMPKIIEGAREKILVNAKRRLFENGYQHLSLREVAKESGIATGTIYNYFANKNYLIAGIMLEDWEIAVKKMDASVKDASTVKEGVLGICEALEAFYNIYACIWQQPSVAAAATPDLQHRKAFFVNQLGKKLEGLLEEKGYGNQKDFIMLIVELILSATGKEVIKEQLGKLLDQLYPSK